MDRQRIPLDLNDGERQLILQHTFADDQLTRCLRIVPRTGESAASRFTLGELEELAGYVAAEANHAKVKQLKKQLTRSVTFQSGPRPAHGGASGAEGKWADFHRGCGGSVLLPRQARHTALISSSKPKSPG
jgi:hypothetical protein